MHSGSGDQLVVDELGDVDATDYDYTDNVALSPLCLLLVLEGGDWIGPSDAGDQPVSRFEMTGGLHDRRNSLLLGLLLALCD